MSNNAGDKRLEFEAERRQRIENYSRDEAFKNASGQWIDQSLLRQYVYNFEWLGRPIIQFPADIIAVQELIWQVKPDLIIETGIAHGGSLVLSASMLAMLEIADAFEGRRSFDPRAPRRKLIGIDIDIREHNRRALEAHPLYPFMELHQGSSIAPDIVDMIRAAASPFQRILVMLDSNHTHDHVLAELEAYAPLVSAGSYCVVFDTVVENLPVERFGDRPWKPGDSPMSALHRYLELLSTEGRKDRSGSPLRFEIDGTIDAKLQLSAAPKGYLRRVK